MAESNAEVSGNIFFQSKAGFKSHLQIKTTVAEGEPMNIVRLLNELEASVVENGGKPENPPYKSNNPNTPMEKAAADTFGAKADTPSGAGECPNGCGERPRIAAGVSNKTGKAYGAFWGECRKCGFKGR